MQLLRKGIVLTVFHVRPPARTKKIFWIRKMFITEEGRGLCQNYDNGAVSNLLVYPDLDKLYRSKGKQNNVLKYNKAFLKHVL